jgi:ribulose-5-phosphate 4-epimerase/fuculose-1-phosphate aldolase
MTGVSDDSMDAFLAACHSVAAHGLLRCSSGNMSQRVGEDTMLITASRSWVGQVVADDIALCRISDGELIAGRKPSVEIGMHTGTLLARPEMNIVLHFQTPFATTIACQTEREIDYFVIPEIPYYIGPIARVPYIMPGTPELAAAVTHAMRDHDLVQLSNHGQVTTGKDFAHAIQNASFFELACEIIVRAGDTLVPMTTEDANALTESY